MHPHRDLIEQFFTGLRDLDAAVVGACYGPEAEYSSLALGRVTGVRVLAFWEIVCARGNLLDLHVERADADETVGHARWSARYACGRLVVDQVNEATFYFKSGRILRHHDRLDTGDRRTIGSDLLVHEERMPLLTRVRAGMLIALERHLAAQREAQPMPPQRPQRLRSATPGRRRARASDGNRSAS